MNKNIFIFLLILQIFSFSFSKDGNAYLEIKRSQSHSEQTGTLTPLVVKLSSDDQKEKTNGVDLICVVDVSGSMRNYNRMNLAKESLKYLVNVMNKDDRLAIVPFNDKVSTKPNFIEMEDGNKEKVIKTIDSLVARGGTNIYAGLKSALDLINDSYTSGEKVASIILLSDGEDNYKNADLNFKNYIKSQTKQDFAFTLHTLGYGDKHDANLMRKLSLIRDGGYFFIRYLSTVNSAILEIYGSLSTNLKVNVELEFTSNYTIEKVMGMDDMYESKLISNTQSTFTTKLIQFVYGKSFNYVVLVNIPQDTKPGVEVLKARVPLFDKEVGYLWDNTLDPYAYEEYIRVISATYFQDAYNAGKTKGKTIMNKANAWIANYDGIRDWKNEYADVVNDLNNFDTYGRANLLSKVRELKSSKLGIHYNDENSYQRKIMDDYFDIDTSNWTPLDIKEETPLSKPENFNYIYFYMLDGIGEINGIHFSGNCSSFVLYSNKFLLLLLGLKYLFHIFLMISQHLLYAL